MENPPATNSSTNLDPEQKLLAEWNSHYAGLDPTIAQGPRDYFLKILRLCAERKQPLILLETPNFELPAHTRFAHAREYLRQQANQYDQVFFLRLNKKLSESDRSLFYDASHLNPRGRIVFTRALLAELVRMQLVQSSMPVETQ